MTSVKAWPSRRGQNTARIEQPRPVPTIRRPSVELALEDWNKVLAVNMTGVFLCSRIAARYMIAAGEGGAIVSTASIMGLSGGGLYPNIC